jgi:pimeloyl-ACP methyl ester carboxylesterase
MIPDLGGRGRSSILSKPFRHADAADDILALLDRLGITSCKGLEISGGGNVLLHAATRQPDRIKAMVLVSATPYFPAQARPIMREYPGVFPNGSGKFCAGAILGAVPKSRLFWLVRVRLPTATMT